jgi:hypothetical protein
MIDLIEYTRNLISRSNKTVLMELKAICKGKVAGVLGSAPIEETISRLREYKTGYLIYGDFGKVAGNPRSLFDSDSIHYDKWGTIDFHERAELVEKVTRLLLACSSDVERRISNGSFCVVLALAALASQVRVSGLSLKGGHSYLGSMETTVIILLETRHSSGG